MDKKLFQYAPGLVGYGSKGKDGSIGNPGISFYFSTLDGLTNITTLTSKISLDQILSATGGQLPDGRHYQTGDVFLDVNGRVFEIDLNLGNLYTDTGMFLNSSTIFQAGPIQEENPRFSRYTNLYESDRILVDSIYANNVANYTEKPNEIYDNPAINFGKINYIDEDIIPNLNDKYLFNLWSTGITGDENAIGLIREGNQNNWHFGNNLNDLD